jgi:hypothetical protein
MTSAVSSNTLTPAQIAALLQQQQQQAQLATAQAQAQTDAQSSSSSTTGSASSAAATVASPLTGGANGVSTDMLSLLMQTQSAGATPPDPTTISNAYGTASGVGAPPAAPAPAAPAASSGSGSGSSSTPVGTITELNPDGSTTTITTNADGSQTVDTTVAAQASTTANIDPLTGEPDNVDALISAIAST